jgi:hypothetical protein
MGDDPTRIRNPTATDTALFERDARNKLLSTCALLVVCGVSFVLCLQLVWLEELPVKDVPVKRETRFRDGMYCAPVIRCSSLLPKILY